MVEGINPDIVEAGFIAKKPPEQKSIAASAGKVAAVPLAIVLGSAVVGLAVVGVAYYSAKQLYNEAKNGKPHTAELFNRNSK